MSIIKIECKEEIIVKEEIIYSKSYSRPSKSIVDPEIYNEYKSLKEPFNLFSDLKEKCLLECLNYMFQSVVNISDNIYSLDGEIYNVIYFTDSKFSNVTNSLKNKHSNYILIMNEIYTYPKIQYVYILGNFFTDVYIVLSQFYNFLTVICKNKKSELSFDVKENSTVKDFNVKVNDLILKDLKKANDSFMKNVININSKINSICKSLSQISNLNREMYTISRYYNAFINKECNINCNCKPKSIFYSDILECYICENCLILTRLFLTF